MCCSSKQALSDSAAEVLQLCLRIMDDECRNEEWSEEKLLNHLKNKLIKAYSNAQVTDEAYQKECDDIINHGIFSEIVISKLLKNGMSKADIINVMKYGLESLKLEHINYFAIFNITEQTMKCSNTLLNNVSEVLIGKLKTMEFSDEESSDIIWKGLVCQNQCCHFRLTSHNIFAAKILIWQGPITAASNSIMAFLEHLGLDEDTLKIVSEKGISAEAKEIIKDLGYSEFNQRICPENVEESTCKCMDKIVTKTSDSNSIQSRSNSRSARGLERSQESYERKHFIRDNLMAPLTWAMSETLKYNPTDPIHYLACQLLRWKHNNVDLSQMKEVVDFVNNAVISN